MFERRLDEALGGGTSVFTTNVPYELDPEEPEVMIRYSVTPAERQTYDSPGHPAYIEIESATIAGGIPEPEGFEDWVYSDEVREMIEQHEEAEGEAAYWGQY